MTQEFKEKWLEALRSGKFKQGTGLFYNDIEDKYCCLGVACVIARKNKQGLLDLGIIPMDFENIPEVLKESNDAGDLHEIASKLIDMNDGNDFTNEKPQSFLQIADWIEQNIPVEDEAFVS